MKIRLPATATAAAEVRRVARLVTGHDHVGEQQREILVLLASEAASNVLRHSSSPELDVTVGCDVRTLAVRVGDHEPPVSLPSPDVHELDEVDGRGLLMIDQLSLSWGLSPTAEGWELWFIAPTQDEAAPVRTREEQLRLAAAPAIPDTLLIHRWSG